VDDGYRLIRAIAEAPDAVRDTLIRNVCSQDT